MVRLAAIVILALLPLLGGCGGGLQTTTYDGARSVASAPDSHRGELHAFSGRVVDAHQHSGGYEVQLSVSKITTTFVVNFPFSQPMDVRESDWVTVLGRVSGYGYGTNGFGGPQRAVLIDGIAVQGQRLAEWDTSKQSTYDAWKAGTLQLGRPASMAVMKGTE